jgi:WD40 repeat protein
VHGRFYVGEWLVEPEQNRLARGSESVKVDPKAVQVLSFLADHPNEILTKEQIIGSVWDGTFVSDEVLTTAIWGLRKALGDDAREPRYIQTIPRRGYRLIAPVEGATLEVSRQWEPSPYPGLAAFSQRDAEYFYGREREVESLWTKLQDRSLLGLIGPSGAGKSSLLKAGLIPATPQGWEVVLYQPRNDVFQRLTAQLDDRQSQTGKKLWVVDQFEELFTLNDHEMQVRFTELLGRASESGVHVLLSMRDDFLIRCHAHPPLAPVFKDLTPILALEGAALRRALTEPARASGYRFEDESLVTEILTEVSQEKGALPLLAFAASKLWEMRDREGRRLTREAYLSIGGVAGALAQHAEATLSSIGAEQEPIVREIFRNLVTGSGTRVPMDREELLTVFSDREGAERVLGQLIDARLLTSSEGEVEVIHESLLLAWPRLVRWQTQDAEGVVLRDQLRQAARQWDDRGRTDDLLWTGTVYREFALWRERYSGGLSSTEESFARAMAERAGRERRRRRIAVSATLLFLATGLAIVAVLWRKSETSALRAEAAKILTLGQLELEENSSGALAYALKSLELADTEEARLFALRVHQGGPTAIRAEGFQEDGLETMALAFSPNGEWVAVGGYRKAQLRHRDGREPVVLQGEYASAGMVGVHVGFAPDGEALATNRRGDVRVWSVPQGLELWRTRIEEGAPGLFVRGRGFLTSTTVDEREILRWSSFEDDETRLIGSMEVPNALDVNLAGTELAYAVGRKVFLRSLLEWNGSEALLAEHATDVLGVAFHPDGKQVAVSDGSGEIRFWSTEDFGRPLRVIGELGPTWVLLYSPDGRWLAGRGEEDGHWVVRLWDLSAPPGAAPLELRTDAVFLNDFTFDPTSLWLAMSHADHTTYWALAGAFPRVIDGHDAKVIDVSFTPEGAELLSASSDDTLRAWSLDPKNQSDYRVLLRTGLVFPNIAVGQGGKQVAVSAHGGRVLVVPIEGGPARELEGFSGDASVIALASSPDGRSLAAAPHVAPTEDKKILVWDLQTGELQIQIPLPDAGEGFEGAIEDLVYADREHLLAGGPSGLVLLDVKRGTVSTLYRPPSTPRGVSLAFNQTGRHGLMVAHNLLRFGLDGEAPTAVPSHEGSNYRVALDPSEKILASSGEDGIVRIGPVSGGDPHLFFGHKGVVRALAFSPDSRWLASCGDDRTIRLWPVPDVTKTPPHKRPYAELLAMLRSWTNWRVVPDSASTTGWKLEVGPFPGWAKLPERWQ